MTSRTRIIVIAVAALAVLGIAGAIAWNAAREARTPLVAVQAYIDAIQNGDATTANRLVDPATYSGYLGEATGATVTPEAAPTDDTLLLDPELLTDEVLDARVGRPLFRSVELDYGTESLPPVGESVEVEVSYNLEDATHRTTLLVEHSGDDWIGMPEWTVTTPLLVPVIVETNEIGAGPMTLGAESARDIPVSGPRVNGAPQHATLLYPGTYFLGGAATDYLLSAGTRLNVGHGALVDVFDTGLGPAVSAQLYYSADVKLVEELEAALPAYLARCTAGAPADDCPTAIRAREDFATDFAVSIVPRLDSVTSYQVEWKDGVPTEPSLRASWTDGRVDYTRSDGESDDDVLRVYAWITIEGAEATIEFRSEI